MLAVMPILHSGNLCFKKIQIVATLIARPQSSSGQRYIDKRGHVFGVMDHEVRVAPCNAKQCHTHKHTDTVNNKRRERYELKARYQHATIDSHA